MSPKIAASQRKTKKQSQEDLNQTAQSAQTVQPAPAATQSVPPQPIQSMEELNQEYLQRLQQQAFFTDQASTPVQESSAYEPMSDYYESYDPYGQYEAMPPEAMDDYDYGMESGPSGDEHGPVSAHSAANSFGLYRDDEEAIAEAAASYAAHCQSGQFSQVISRTGAGAVTEAIAQVEPSVVSESNTQSNLGVKRDMTPQERDAVRLQLALQIYPRHEIYADPYFAQPVVSWAQQASQSAQQDFLYDRERWHTDSVLNCALNCPSLVSRISVASVDYLQQHFPLGNDEDQEQFNVLMLVLFTKMEDGDICVNLSSLDSVYSVIARWNDAAQRPLVVLNPDEDDAAVESPEQLERFVMMVKRYAPLSVVQMHDLLGKSLAVGTTEDQHSPLVFDLHRLYLRRYYNYEKGIADYISQATAPELSAEQEDFLKQAIEILFPSEAEPGSSPLDVNWQKMAALMATTSNFNVVSGGPGTGKTTTVLRILLLLLCLDPQNRLIQLCAPTGKAAARMGESILKQLKDERTAEKIEALAKLSHLSAEEIKSFIPQTAVTVQRLIKVRPNHATPIFNAEHKLLCDVLVVDEVSMLDLALFYRLLQAIEPRCKLILLGDKDQLASVEAGAVLAELCSRLNLAAEQRLQERTLDFLSRMSGYSPKQLLDGKIADHVTLLQFSYRSKDVPQIGQLAALVNNAPRAQDSGSNLELPHNQQQGEIYSYLQLKERAEDALSFMGMGEIADDDPCKQQLERIKELFAQDEQQTLESIGLLEPVLVPESAAKPTKKRGKGKTAAAAAAADTAEVAYPEFKPAISYVQLRQAPASVDADNSEQKAQIESFRKQLAQQAIARGVKENYSQFLEQLEKQNFVVSADPDEREKLFKLMDRFRILCSNHHGALGDKALNEAICEEVKRTYLQGYGYFGPNDFFPGQIIIITKNDPVLGLVNGYVGFCAYEEKTVGSNIQSDQSAQLGTDPSATESESGSVGNTERVLRVFIPTGVEEKNGKSVTKVNVISTLLLTNYDTGYAMSIHKSQGSEYDKITMVLADRVNRVLTKELVYTGITRAKKCVQVVSSDNALLYAIGHSVDRESGLAERLLQGAQDPVVMPQAQPEVKAQKQEPAPSNSEPAEPQEQPKPKARATRATKAKTGTTVTKAGTAASKTKAAATAKPKSTAKAKTTDIAVTTKAKVKSTTKAKTSRKASAATPEE
ncbi:MAG TPA: AAA family ATPase [Candidatus Anaerobiospirillum pullistercoris]|uniref:RecBCD enzyme subunit RecD n=1 Tax=Candidatus Anaerobiospirillum pullistercoris TaxID=2838452 RepID=A0A9D1WCJ7_9GAMM|nr:AAA family ATPase [Candidatus Anaerobiospirillum pullistercoris]